MTNLWLPGGRGMTSLHERAAAKAVREYAPDLMLGQDPQGFWGVYVENGPNDGRPFKVFDLGRELPSPDRIQELLYRSDTRRHGSKLVEQIERKNAARRRELARQAGDAAGEVAEVVEWAARKDGWHPNPRIFVPGKD